MNDFDVCILGSGPGGYVAALCAVSMGQSVCIIEENELGGTCLNTGCIPTKALISSARLNSAIAESVSMGINASSDVETGAVLKRSLRVRDDIKKGLGSLLKSRNIVVKKCKGRLLGGMKIQAGEEIVSARNIIIATGSTDAELEKIKCDGVLVHSSASIWMLKKVPDQIIIVGAGAIGCEFADIYSSLGAKVTLIEAAGRILPRMDAQASEKLEYILSKKGVDILTSAGIASSSVSNGKVVVTLEDRRNVTADIALVAVGRVPNIFDIGLEKAAVSHDGKRIIVDTQMRTRALGIYAIGDCVGQAMLAHAAMREAVVCVTNISGATANIDYNSVPNCVFTDPEIAQCGMDETAATQNGFEPGIVKFSMKALGKAHASGKTEGFIKITYCKKTERLLGGVIFGEGASELIAVISLAIKKKLSVRDVADTVFVHPSFSEGIFEAANMAAGRKLHSH